MSLRQIPSPADYLLQEHLYETLIYGDGDIEKILKILYFGETYDSYCTACGREATFKARQTIPSEYVSALHNEQNLRKLGSNPSPVRIRHDVFCVRAACTRNNSADHMQQYYILNDRTEFKDDGKKSLMQNVIIKIGQYPSFADLQIPRMKKYMSVIDRPLLTELNKAIGLASHDVGVGAYVYLRRVFEALVEEAHKVASLAPRWNEKIYKKSRMNEKIKRLKNYLPEFLVEHPAMYALLSKGVHELTEAECLDHFKTLQIGIELILDQKIEKADRERKVKDAKAALSKAVGSVTSNRLPP